MHPRQKQSFLYLATCLLFAVMSFLFVFVRSQSPVPTYNPLSVRPLAEPEKIANHIPKPKVVRGLYLTAYSAGNEKFRRNLIARIKNGKINSVVIDIKDYSGHVLYNSNLPEVKKKQAVEAHMRDISQVLTDFHRAKIYVIARQTIFQDPVLAISNPELAFHTMSGEVWKDRKGLAWMDPNQEAVWQYNLAIAREAAKLGFDEINFDYIRYPSDGNIANLDYNLPDGRSKTEVLKNFFSYLDKNLKNVATTSVDMFGLVMDNTGTDYDLGIGQKITDAADYFDFVCPMLYASHYAQNYLGFENSAEHPGEVVAYGLAISQGDLKNKKARIRPWLQAFDLGAVYDQGMIAQQIEAVQNVTSTDGWLLWNARNDYPDYIF
ncbi:MAG: hypothetical protein C3F02_03195 [Parcubacteria group bacterium]|nr:MAG: hypothetical protein C3F02_03195 [Parcubacteria group bacterium]